MVRTRRESHHCNGITDPKRLQPSFATKSAQSGHQATEFQCLLLGVKRTSCRDADISLPIPSAFGLLEKQSQVGGSRSLTADPETLSFRYG